MTSAKKSLPPLKAGTLGTDLPSSDLGPKKKLQTKLSEELSPIPSPKKRVSINTDKNVVQNLSSHDLSDKNVAAKQKSLQLKLSGKFSLFGGGTVV